MLINADLHIHSPFSGGTSDKINLESIAEGARRKGLQVVATGDCLHPLWERHIKEYYHDGTIEVNGIHFILSVEVEDMHRVHHLLLFPDFDSVNQFKEMIEKRTDNMEHEGRPSLHMNGMEILDIAMECDALIGPAHAFTPWTSLYAYFDSVMDYYGKKPHFLELGLSADSNYADRIRELHSIPFLSNSDAHSPSPHRLGREFNRMEVEEVTWDAIKKAILNGGIKYNVGFPPEKGKYNRTACTSCYRQYDVKKAMKMGWRCRCGGVIKKGVRDRVEEIADQEVMHPSWRGKYIHILPLAEIIAVAINEEEHSSIVRKRWEEMTKESSEIEILLDIDMDEIKRASPPVVADAIEKFREGSIKIIPGGGGKYGEIVIK